MHGPAGTATTDRGFHAEAGGEAQGNSCSVL